MSKAILVMDMPSKCIECPCCNIGAFYDVCRVLNEATTCADNGKPDWCPLKPIPSKKEEWIKTSGRSKGVHGAKRNGFNTGYNACIDEILGGGE